MSGARPAALRRGATIGAIGQLVLAAVMAYAALTSGSEDRSMFAALAISAILGAAASGLLVAADRRSAVATRRISQSSGVTGLGFGVGALGAILAGNPLVLVLPVVLLFISAMLIATARGVQSQPPAG